MWLWRQKGSKEESQEEKVIFLPNFIILFRQEMLADVILNKLRNYFAGFCFFPVLISSNGMLFTAITFHFTPHILPTAPP